MKKNTFLKIFLSLFIVIIVALALLVGFYFWTDQAYKDKIFVGGYVGSVDVSGKTVEAAKKEVNKKIDDLNQEGIIFHYNLKNIVVYPVSSSSDGELSEVLFSFNGDDAIKAAFEFGRSGNFGKDFFERLESFLFQKKHSEYLSVKIDNEKVLKIIEKDLSDYNYKNASYYLNLNGELGVVSESRGKKFLYDQLLFEKKLEEMDFSRVDLVVADMAPEIYQADCVSKKEEVAKMLEVFPIVLNYDGENWFVQKRDLLNWIILEKNKNELIVKISDEKIVEYLKKNISPYVGSKSVVSQLVVENGRVKGFDPGSEGSELDIELAKNDILKFLKDGEGEIELKTKSMLTSFSVKDEKGSFLGIKEIVGQSSLAFGGSTAGRIKNIKNGASKISGMLIAPGEEFSTLKSLGTIDEASGFVKEAVINGRVITQELGGGLCHLSTTLFRTVLDAGFPVTARQNHSYSMSYYTPAGTDAAIYDPNPDFKFINDTANYILIRAWVDNTELTVQFWGTKDGRSVVRTVPVTYNIVQPKAAKIVTSKNVAKGKKVCSYAAYIGLDAYFDYKVTYADGTLKENRFTSHYVPRQGICTVGE